MVGVLRWWEGGCLVGMPHPGPSPQPSPVQRERGMFAADECTPMMGMWLFGWRAPLRPGHTPLCCRSSGLRLLAPLCPSDISPVGTGETLGFAMVSSVGEG